MSFAVCVWRFAGRAATARALAAVAALALAGCSNFSLNPVDWFTKSKPPPPAPLQTIASPIPVRVMWQVSVGKGAEAALSPAVVGDRVFAAGGDGTVVRLEAATGKEIWRVRVPSRISGGVGADGRLVVVGSEEGEVIALDEDGRMLWRARVSSEVLAPPVVAGDLVIVRSADSRIFALDGRDGRRRWLYQRAAPALAVRSPAGAVVRGGYVFAGFSGGKLVALTVGNGGLRWEGTVSLPKGTRLEATVSYDNSAANKRNPSRPPVRVYWGEESNDEMGSIGLQVVAANRGELPQLQQAIATHIRERAFSGPGLKQLLQRRAGRGRQ